MQLSYNLDVMINLTSPGDEELECVVGEKSGQLESENHPWVSRDIVLFQIPDERGSQTEKEPLCGGPVVYELHAHLELRQGFLDVRVDDPVDSIHLKEETRSNKEENKASLCKLTKPHFRV